MIVDDLPRILDDVAANGPQEVFDPVLKLHVHQSNHADAPGPRLIDELLNPDDLDSETEEDAEYSFEDDTHDKVRDARLNGLSDSLNSALATEERVMKNPAEDDPPINKEDTDVTIHLFATLVMS